MLSTVILIGALSGYGRGAYANCFLNKAPADFLCWGNDVTVTQTIDANNAAVRAFYGFHVDTTDTGGHAVAITGNGALSYIDIVDDVSLTGAESALDCPASVPIIGPEAHRVGLLPCEIAREPQTGHPSAPVFWPWISDLQRDHP